MTNMNDTLSKAKIKLLQSLQQKKHRLEEQLFVVEGEKTIDEVLRQSHFELNSLYVTKDWIENNPALVAQYKTKITTITPIELKKISSLSTPNQVLAVLKIPSHIALFDNIQTSLSLVLENMQDPGNMGTIIRIADWFGISNIFCSKGCVDIYNPKVLQASMGSFLRVNVHYTDLENLFSEHSNLPIYGAVLGGDNLFKTNVGKKGFLLIGNEGNGLSEEILKFVNHKITIPKFGGAESLNAAVATGILCAFFSQ